MSTISAFEAKTRFGELLDRVIAGEEVVITRHEKPVARIIREGGPNGEEIRRAAEGLEALQKEIAAYSGSQSAMPWSEFKKKFIEEGRK